MRPSAELVLTLLALGVAGCASTPRSEPVPAPAPAASVGSTATSPATSAAAADSLRDFGRMWTYDAPPLDYWRRTYGFAPDQHWLDHLRLASVRLPNCSASFVSARGLVLTNHHCARECTADVSPPDTNFVQTGFSAATLAEERKCPDFYVDQLQSIEDVTPRVAAALTASDAAGQARQQDSVTHAIEGECAKATSLRCQVVTLYQGGRFSLYRYRRFTDVRLVMAPEVAIAFFGGDPDNFTYPRYDLDMTLLRVYENGAPFAASDYLRWSTAGARDSDVVFVSGNPGQTQRLLTVAQLEALRDVDLPAQLEGLRRILGALRDLAAQDPARARMYQNRIFGVANSEKALTGEYAALRDTTIMNRKGAFERAFRAHVAADPALRAQYANAWDAVAAAERQRVAVTPRLRWSRLDNYWDPLPQLAVATVRVVLQSALPDSARMASYRGAGLDAHRQQVLQDIPIDLVLERRAMTDRLRAAARELPPTDPFIRTAMSGRTPDAAAERLVDSTHLTTVAGRKALIDGGPAAVAASTDPMIVLARTMDPIGRALAAKADTLRAAAATNTARIGRALYATYGTALPPDATFTLRITDGVVRGYPMNGTEAPSATTLYGLYDRSASFGDKAPFNLPPRWVAGRSRLDLTTPFDFVSTADIIGGNSGSPVVNRNGELVGLIFDGNIESLSSDIIYSDYASRAVAVESRAMTEALRTLYNGTRIADELEGR